MRFSSVIGTVILNEVKHDNEWSLHKSAIVDEMCNIRLLVSFSPLQWALLTSAAVLAPRGLRALHFVQHDNGFAIPHPFN